MQKVISFIHLSDIHFNKNSGDIYDLDKDLRNEIQRDIKKMQSESIDKIDGILVCGDIAFSGDVIEYETALDFLKSLCIQLGIPETSVLCVPGNHDVNHKTTKDSCIFLEVQDSIKNADDYNAKITKYSRDKENHEILYKHIDNYNTKFASKFSCNISAEKPIWEQDFVLNDGTTLRIVGLNSVMTSNHMDHQPDGTECPMIVGEYQLPLREENVAYVSLCHHPPNCWKDAENNIKNKMNAIVQVQLYGHNHNQQIFQIGNNLVIGSGATHPSRLENDWIPMYNWLSFHVEESDGKRYLKIKVFPRIFSRTNNCFIADSVNSTGNTFREYTISLNVDENGLDELNDISISKDPAIPVDNNGVLATEITIKSSTKALVYRFLSLSFVDRSSILTKFELLNEEDEGVNHVDILHEVLERAKAFGNIKQFEEEVDRLYNS